MNQINTNLVRILALAPISKGVGFSVVEDTLIDWGVKIIKGEEKNKQSVAWVKELIAKYRPGIIVLQNTKNSQRSARIKALCQQITTVAKTQKIKMSMFSHEQVRGAFFGEVKGTKDALAEILAKQFPELISCLPPKRKAWMSESYQMGIFDAVALALVFRRKTAKPDLVTKKTLD